MTKTEEIKQDIEKLNFNIQQLLTGFILRNGSCEIRIDVNQSFYTEQSSDVKIPLRLDVKTEIRI